MDTAEALPCFVCPLCGRFRACLLQEGTLHGLGVLITEWILYGVLDRAHKTQFHGRATRPFLPLGDLVRSLP